jgi:hypothetical protein
MTRHQLITNTLKLSIEKENKEKQEKEVLRTALELLDRRIQTMQVQINENRGDYSYKDLEDFILSAKFLNNHYGRTYSFLGVEEILNKI